MSPGTGGGDPLSRPIQRRPVVAGERRPIARRRRERLHASATASLGLTPRRPSCCADLRSERSNAIPATADGSCLTWLRRRSLTLPLVRRTRARAPSGLVGRVERAVVDRQADTLGGRIQLASASPHRAVVRRSPDGTLQIVVLGSVGRERKGYAPRSSDRGAGAGGRVKAASQTTSWMPERRCSWSPAGHALGLRRLMLSAELRHRSSATSRAPERIVGFIWGSGGQNYRACGWSKR
jgi:hypothetical protein